VVQRMSEPGLDHWKAGFALREESPIIVAHLADGCPSCAAGLEVFHQADAPDRVRQAVLEMFERELLSTLQASGSSVQALHAALAGVALSGEKRAD